MTRRAAVLVLSSVLSFVLAIAAFYLPVPYAAIAPGPTFDALGTDHDKPIIAISGHDHLETHDGQLRLVTVEVYGKPVRLTIGEAIHDWLDPKVAVVPIDNIYPKQQTTKQIDENNQRDMLQSQLEAKVAALGALHIPVTVAVFAADKGFPADGVLRAGDIIVSVDSAAVTSLASLTDLIGRHKPGEPVSVLYSRGGVAHNVSITTVASPDDAKRAVIGIAPDFKLPFTIDINLASVGGPSAGLMFSLAIYDKLSDGHLAFGTTIAGTGTIDANGTVGPIGGIQQKVYGARRDGATVFLVPHDNCKDIATVPPGLRLIDVTTISDALADLATLRAGGTPAGCAAP